MYESQESTHRWTIHSIRRAGLAGAVGGGLTAAAGLVVAAIIQPSSDVADDRWSFPWSSDALVPVSVLYALLHALVVVGLLGLARSGVVGETRSGRAGLALAVTGTGLLGVAELASILVADQRMDDTGASLVGALFGVANLLAATGLVLAGVATVRAARWTGWRRYSPLVTGIVLVLVLGLAMTPFLAAGIAVYGLGVLACGLAVATQPVPVPARPRYPAVRV